MRTHEPFFETWTEQYKQCNCGEVGKTRWYLYTSKSLGGPKKPSGLTLLRESTKQPSHLKNHNHVVNNSGLTGCEGGKEEEKAGLEI